MDHNVDSAPRRVIVIGGHPDDPEMGAGGLAALAARAGHEVTFVYLTDGQAGVDGLAGDAAADVRRAEAQLACQFLGVRPHFLGQADGASTVDLSWFARVRCLLDEAKPDLVITHWLVDTHRDHRACGFLVYDAWIAVGRAFPLYYMEVMSGQQTQSFRPTDRIDISEVAEMKHEACFMHSSQHITAHSYETWLGHGIMERFRGFELGVDRAEAFARQEGSPSVDFARLVRSVQAR